MKSIINCNKKNLKCSKTFKYQRRSSLNSDNNNNKNIKNKNISSYYKTNKTIQKYVNEKLNIIKNNININKTLKDISRNSNHNFNIKNNSFFRNNSKNSILNKKLENNRKIKGRNNKNEEIYKNKFSTNELYDIPKLLNYEIKNKNKENLKKKINNKINNIINSPNIITKGKLAKDFYQNYSSSMSMSTGISLNHNNEIIKPYNDFFDNQYLNYNSKEKEEKSKTINSNNNYEIDSIDDDNIITFKQGENASSITFGNSFSYTNSKRNSNSTKKECNNNIDKSIFILKNQNETLKKKLKKSNRQIIILKHEIEKLMNYKNNINLRNKNKEVKINHGSKAYLDKSNIYDASNEGRNSNSSYKSRILKKDKRKIKI